MKQRLLIVFAMAAIAGVNQAKADVVFMSVPGTSFAYNQSGNDGFTFTPNENIIVTALDYYVSPDTTPADTLINSHGVGIYSVNNTSTPLVTATVGSCDPCTLVGGNGSYSSFASVALLQADQIELYAGQQYMLAGYSQPNEYENGGLTNSGGIPLGTIVTPSAITLNGYYYDYSGSLDYPTIPYGTGYVGPDFQFTAATPDGGTTLALLGIAIVGLAGLRRKLSL
jgi:hypothetical protein